MSTSSPEITEDIIDSLSGPLESDDVVEPIWRGIRDLVLYVQDTHSEGERGEGHITLGPDGRIRISFERRLYKISENRGRFRLTDASIDKIRAIAREQAARAAETAEIRQNHGLTPDAIRLIRGELRPGRKPQENPIATLQKRIERTICDIGMHQDYIRIPVERSILEVMIDLARQAGFLITPCTISISYSSGQRERTFLGITGQTIANLLMAVLEKTGNSAYIRQLRASDRTSYGIYALLFDPKNDYLRIVNKGKVIRTG